jgi:hypothetical protein
MKKRQSSAPSILDSACGGFSLLGIWRENRVSLLLAAALVAAVVILFIWLARRRRQDAFPELHAEAKAEKAMAPAPESDMGMTQIEGQPSDIVREPDSPSPGLHGKIEVVVHGQQISSYLITDNPLPIGRDPGQSLVVIPEPIVSKLHCQIFARGGHVFVRDLNSTNGIYVNDEKISERELQDNDTVFLGKKGTVRIIYHR